MAAESPPQGSFMENSGSPRADDSHDHDTSLRLLQLGIAATQNETDEDIPLTQQHRQLLRECSNASSATTDDIVQQSENRGEHVRDVLARKTDLSQELHDRISSLPAGIDANNIIAPRDEDESELKKGQPASSAPTSTYTLRNRDSKQNSKLIYDLKYHPMDDSIRSSQAARRRSAHGEEQLLSDDCSDTTSEHADEEVDKSMQSSDESEPEERPKHSTKSKKRTLAQSNPSVPTRRSSRRTANPKSAYNMKIHPQDSDLRMLSDEENEVRSPSSKRRKLRCTSSMIDIGSDDEAVMENGVNHPSSNQDVELSDSDPVSVNDETNLEENRGLTDKMSTSLPVVTPPSPHTICVKEGMDVWKLPAGSRYFRHERDSWAVPPGQPFEIFTESLEDQLAAEALALSPLNYKHDDKENIVQDSGLQTAQNSVSGSFVVSASHYRRRRANSQIIQEIALVNHALYDTVEEARQPYGFSSSHVPQGGPLTYVSILRSSSQLVPAPTGEEVQEDAGISAVDPSFTIRDPDVEAVTEDS